MDTLHRDDGLIQERWCMDMHEEATCNRLSRSTLMGLMPMLIHLWVYNTPRLGRWDMVAKNKILQS